jgi:microcystin-dependent protein
MPTIDMSVQIPPLPAGWKGSPDDLLQFLAEEGVFTLQGDFPAAQVGGARPTEDVGIWYGDDSIERFTNGKYRPISDVPIGAIFPFAGTGAVIPANYLLCDGRLVLRDDYAELFAVIGTVYNRADDIVTSFRLPDYRGRVPVGAGVGDYISQGVTGVMREVVAGQYSGFEWPHNIKGKAPGAPKTTKLINYTIYLNNVGNVTESFPPRIGQQFIIRSR